MSNGKDPIITDEAVAAAARVFFGGAYGAVGDEGNKVLHDGAREALEAAAPYLTPDREALARAAHHYFCIRRSELNHDPRQSDYDKADEMLEILALLIGPEEKS